MIKEQFVVKKECRVCGGRLSELINFGDIHPSNFLAEGAEPLGPFPLVLSACEECKVVQLAHNLALDLSYRQYWYKSGLNPSMVAALKEIADETMARVPLSPRDTVVDIGCNDGTLLSFFPSTMNRVGYEPALNLAEDARRHCDELISDYFKASAYDGPMAKVITSIAMFYDLDDPHAFINGIKEILLPEGIWVIQMMDLRSMMETGGFDNVCFEHLVYYTLQNMVDLLEGHGLRVCDVAHNAVNGGSLRVYVSRDTQVQATPVLARMLEEEAAYLQANPIRTFWEKVAEDCSEIGRIVRGIAYQGPVHIMGASTKGNTLLQMCGLDSTVIEAAAEVNSDKYGLRTVGTNIPIISEEQSMSENPAAYLVLPWHFAEFLLNKHKDYLRAGGSFIIPLPTPQVFKAEPIKSNVATKTTAFLIDELITTCMKCWYAQEDVMHKEGDSEVAEAARSAQLLNSRRNELIRAIDSRLGEGGISVTSKTYTPGVSK